MRRDHLMPALSAAGFKCFRPRGAYYVMTDISAFGLQGRRFVCPVPGAGNRRGHGSRVRASIVIPATAPNKSVSPSANARNPRRGSPAPGKTQHADHLVTAPFVRCSSHGPAARKICRNSGTIDCFLHKILEYTAKKF